MKKIILSSLVLLSALAVSGEIPAGYYSGLEGKTKSSLKLAAKQAAKKHTAISYGDATWDAFESTDTRMVGNDLCWWDMYSANNVKVANGHPNMNVEHGVANSWWGGSKIEAYKDLFHLNPSDAAANNRKSNFPLGIVKTQTYTNGVTTVGKPSGGDCGGAPNVFEPHDMYKGDFARAYFYMFTIYDDISWSVSQDDRNFMFDGSSYPSLRPWAYEMLLQWAKEDPVSQKEIDRNEAIYKVQGNRNPFIDFPELAEYIWGDKTSTAFYIADQDVVVPVDPEPVDPNDPDDPIIVDPIDPVPTADWYPVTAVSMLEEGQDYILVSVKDRRTLATKTISSGAAIDYATDVVEVSDNNVAKTPCADAAILRLESISGGNWLLHAYDMKGNSVGYIESATLKTTKYVDAATSSCSVDIVPVLTPGNEETQINFAVGKLQYNASAPRFTTYTSSQQKLQLYRKSESVTSVSANFETDSEEYYFDLCGRKVSRENATPGLYIYRGRKVMVCR